MKALRFEKVGSLDELKIQEVPVPVPVVNSFLVEVKAAGFDPSERQECPWPDAPD